LGLLQEAPDAAFGARPRFSPITEIEHETGIAHGLTAEAGGTDVLVIKKLFNVTK
jgi:hypothetical protein